MSKSLKDRSLSRKPEDKISPNSNFEGFIDFKIVFF